MQRTAPSPQSDRKKQFLPGVAGPASTAPAAIHDAARSIRAARVRATIRDVVDTFLLLAVDFFFLFWRPAHIPFLSRDVSLSALLVLHLFFVWFWFSSRIAPQWKARRISRTWSAEERRRCVIR
ncbi:MAG TPA: hypothetical protein VHL58_17770 [Thermoanaerobaculia bacterium]|nr:hypothetical protein [Thermoanaerobaculia bacterium]